MTTIVTQEALQAQLTALGVSSGDLLVVHTSFGQIGPVQGGPQGFIAALENVLGPRGTLMMPSMSDNDELFDPLSSTCKSMGVVANTFWQLPGVSRSDNPHAFAAKGPLAGVLLAEHPVVVPHGIDSPPGRAIGLGGKVLLAGVGHDANTTIHVAETDSDVQYGFCAKSLVRQAGVTVELRYREVDHCCRGFERVGEALQATGRQRKGPLGNGQATLVSSRATFAVAREMIRRDREALLCSSGSCNFCDEARKGYKPQSIVSKEMPCQ